MLKYDIYSLTNFGIWLKDATVSYNYFKFLHLFQFFMLPTMTDLLQLTTASAASTTPSSTALSSTCTGGSLKSYTMYVNLTHSPCKLTLPLFLQYLFYLNSQKNKKKNSTTQIIMEHNILTNVCIQYLWNLLQIIADYLLCSYNALTQLLNAVL